MTDIKILLSAIETLRPELPALVGEDWAKFEVQLDSYLEQVEAATPEQISILRAKILLLFARYRQAQQCLAELLNEGVTIRSGPNADEAELEKALTPSAEPRYLNAGFFTVGRDDKPVESKQPLSLADSPYRLGVNVGSFGGLACPIHRSRTMC